MNARGVKNVPGRKTDVDDAQWLQQLNQYGLLRGSFRPHERLLRLRTILRHRQRLIDAAATQIQLMQKALMQMNVQLQHAVTDIVGITGLRIIRAIVEGVHDPATLAQHRDVRCKGSVDTIQEALSGDYRPEHVFAPLPSRCSIATGRVPAGPLARRLRLYDLRHTYGQWLVDAGVPKHASRSECDTRRL